MSSAFLTTPWYRIRLYARKNVSSVVPADSNSTPVARVTRPRASRRSDRIEEDAPAVFTAYEIGSHGFQRTGTPPTRSRNLKAPSTLGRWVGATLGEGVGGEDAVAEGAPTARAD